MHLNLRVIAVDDPGTEATAAKIWAVYVAEAEKYDKGLMESWKSDMEGMLIFVSPIQLLVTAASCKTPRRVSSRQA